MQKTDASKIKEAVQERYGDMARKASICCAPGSGTQRVELIYGADLIADLPESVVEASAGCGNPLAMAKPQPGEVILDLGSGGGIDCFLAARKVGKQGRVIGIDMTPDMVALARANARKLRTANVEFRLGDIEQMPVDDTSVDAIISNCVINLSPDKAAVFREAFRVLKPGGRLCVSDMVLLGEIPEEVRGSMDEWARCISGALLKEQYLGSIKGAGFQQVEVLEETPASNPTGWRKNLASIKVRALKSPP